MRIALAVVGAALLLAVGATYLRNPAPEVSPLPLDEVRKLAGLSDSERQALLARLAEQAQTGPMVPQVLLVQLAEEVDVIVIEAPAVDGSDEEPVTGWDIPWDAAVEAIRTEPDDVVTAWKTYRDIGFRHDIYPVARDEGLYLLVNSAGFPPSFSGWRLAAIVLALLLIGSAFRPSA
jgi:hypothetical protein